MESAAAGSSARSSAVPGGCYRVQVLVVGGQKRWRDEAAAHVRNAGCQATACDLGVDAMTVLALGLPVDVMVIDVALGGGLCCSRLAVEARTLRPNLRIVLASTLPDADLDAVSDLIPDALTVERGLIGDGRIVGTVREALAGRHA